MVTSIALKVFRFFKIGYEVSDLSRKVIYELLCMYLLWDLKPFGALIIMNIVMWVTLKYFTWLRKLVWIVFKLRKANLNSARILHC